MTFKKLHAILTVILSIFLILISPMNPNYIESLTDLPNLYQENIEIFSTTDDLFIICSSNDSSSSIICFEADTKKVSNPLQLNYKYQAIAVYENNIYILKPTIIDSTTTYSVEKYTYNSDFSFKGSISIGKYKISNSNNFELNNNNMFFIDDNSRNKIISYNFDSMDTHEFSNSNSIFTSIVLNDNNLYATTTENTLISFDINNSSSQKYDSSPDDHFKFLKDNILVTMTNKIYQIVGHQIEEKLIIENDGSRRSSCYRDGYILGQVSDKTIYCYSSDTFAHTHTINLSSKIISLSNSSNVAIALLKDGDELKVKLITNEDYLKIGSSDIPDIEDNTFKISSTTYNIDFDKKIVNNIPTGTTVSQFKSNINNPEKYSITFTNHSGKTLSSGSLGTNSTMYITKGTGELLTLKIIISGDVTGEGNINSKDISTLKNHLFDKERLEDIYLSAADLNNDGKVDTLDLLLMNKSIEN